MAKTTRATTSLTRLGIAFTVHGYDYDPDAESIGLQAAEALGEPPSRVLKTLMAELDGKLTGYHVGGISPFGQKKAVPTAIELAALSEPHVFINAGQRGLQVRLEPNDARLAMNAVAASVVA